MKPIKAWAVSTSVQVDKQRNIWKDGIYLDGDGMPYLYRTMAMARFYGKPVRVTITVDDSKEGK